jgi:hypothetical protein
VAAFSWILVSLAAVYATIFFLMDSPVGAAILVLGAFVGICSLCVLRGTGSQFVAGSLTTAAFFGVLTALVCRLGGHGAHALAWYAGVPVVALSTLGRRPAFFWFGVTTATLAMFFALHAAGYTLPNDLTPSHYELLGLLSWIGLIALILGLALVYQTAKEQMEDALRINEERLDLAMSVANDGINDGIFDPIQPDSGKSSSI